MEINREGLELIKRFEGLRLEAYQDVAGIWTIGYGHIRTAKPGMVITEQEAERLLKEDLRDAERAVSDLVKVKINENEFSALVSLVFNIGRGAFSRSTTLRKLNAGDHKGAADAIELWNKATVSGKKTVVQGLVRRRAAEKALFLKPVPGETGEGRPAPAPAPKSPKAEAPTQAEAPKSAPPPRPPAEPKPEAKAPPPTPKKEPEPRPKPAAAGAPPPSGKSEGGGGIGAGPIAVAAGGTAAAGAGTVAATQPNNPMVARASDFVTSHGQEFTWLLAGLIFLAALYALHALTEGGSGSRR